ncbi:histidine phosphatase family protein [Bacillus songklensis]|uniref:Histidine phosphatase family protein n=1 Tax=Bacillus songklensis TaxID=1069116 RepID=A0ABV8B6J2_9BACI
MKIGLVRHFKVKRGYPEKRFVTQKELFQWLDEYEASDIEVGETSLGSIEWKRCFASDLPRAAKTAETIYDGNIIKMKELREVQIYPLFKRDIKLPFLLYPILIRMAWLLKHKSQLERKADVEKRVKAILDDILSQSDENILIVSHGALMMFMRKELLKRGFKGPKMKTPENGKLYVFEK